MASLEKQILHVFDNWRTTSDHPRRIACLGVIHHFDDHPQDIEAVCELTSRLANSGERWAWPEDIHPRVDVPSTGGPCSLTTLICPYILAANGCFVPKLSVPGSVAGAIDVLGVIEGFQVQLEFPEMLSALRHARIAHSENTDRLAPADGALFRVRSEVGKKGVPALVVASLLSKTLAVACGSAVFDIRCWQKGNFGHTVEACRENCRLLVEAGRRLGVKCVCVVTGVSIPRISHIGRSESLFAMHQIMSSTDVDSLDADMRDHAITCIRIAAEGLLASGLVGDMKAARRLAEDAVCSGNALESLYRHVEAQQSTRGDVLSKVEHHRAAQLHAVNASQSGTVNYIRLAKLQAL